MTFAAALQKAIDNVNSIPGLGQSITIRRVTSGKYDADTGEVRETTSTSTKNAVIGEVNQREVNSLIQSDDRTATISAAGVTNPPTTADEVVIGTDVFQIIRVTTVKQAGVDVSYKMYLRG